VTRLTFQLYPVTAAADLGNAPDLAFPPDQWPGAIGPRLPTGAPSPGQEGTSRHKRR